MFRFMLIMLAFVGLILAVLLYLVFSPDCYGPEYLVNDYGGCELVD
jgi:hypothetical protein